MKYIDAYPIAQRIVEVLKPHCEKIEIAGSIRRKKPEVKDIEIVCIPKPYGTGIFLSGFAEVVNKWQKIKGELPCKYTQRLIKGKVITTTKEKKTGKKKNNLLDVEIKLDLFTAELGNWGFIFAVRTVSAEYSKYLAKQWVSKGFKGVDGFLTKNGVKVHTPTEESFFELLDLDYIEPELRNL